MNLKLKKVVKNNVVDYGTPDEIRRGFENKFHLFTIMKDYNKNFERKLVKNNTERSLIAKKYYKSILTQKKRIDRLKSIRKNFKNIFIKNNENHLYNINHMNDIYRIEKSQNFQFKSPKIDSFYNNNQTVESFRKSININEGSLFKNRFKTNENEKMIYSYDFSNIKKINNIKSDYFKLRYKDYVQRKRSILNMNNINSFTNNNNEQVTNDSLNIKNNIKENVKTQKNISDNDSYIFVDYEFNNYKTTKELQNKYNFFNSKKLDMDKINTRYFLMIKKMLNNSPVIKLHSLTKGSERIVKKIKTRYILKKNK